MDISQPGKGVRGFIEVGIDINKEIHFGEKDKL
jgi:hypothetical protein